MTSESLPVAERVIIRTGFDVETIQQVGDDLMIAKAAWVSTGNDTTRTEGLSEKEVDDKVKGVLGFLMKGRHGTPFEHGFLTIRVSAPIFIWREWHRHRIGFSYNEESGRYKKLDPVFYVPGCVRQHYCIKPEGFKPSQPGFRGFLSQSDEKMDSSNDELVEQYIQQYTVYEKRLAEGYDNGLARINLPVSLYSACYVSCNPRSLMAFLELRTDEQNVVRRSHPLWEFHTISKQVEDIFAQYWPITHKLWVENGRVAP